MLDRTKCSNMGRFPVPLALPICLVCLIASFVCTGGIPRAPHNISPSQEEKKKTLILYFRHEIDKKQATWLVRPYGLKIIRITEITPVISFSTSDTKLRRAQVEDLQSEKINQSIAEFIEIPPKIFVIPNSKDDLNEILRVLKGYKLEPTADTYPATAEVSVAENETEEWKTRLALDSGVAMVGEDGILYVTRNFDLPGPEYADIRLRLVSASKSFFFIPFDPRMPSLPRPRRSQPPRPLIPQDLSEACTVSPTANLPKAIETVVHRLFGNKPTEIIPIADGDPGLVQYTIVGARRLVTRNWEYYELAIEFNTTGKRVELRAFIKGWSARAPSPPHEKSAYREDLEEEKTQRDRLQSKLKELLENIKNEFCNVTQPRAANDRR